MLILILLHSLKWHLAFATGVPGEGKQSNTATVRRTRTTKIHCFAFSFSSFRLHFAATLLKASLATWLSKKINIAAPASTTYCVMHYVRCRTYAQLSWRSHKKSQWCQMKNKVSHHIKYPCCYIIFTKYLFFTSFSLKKSQSFGVKALNHSIHRFLFISSSYNNL